MGHGDRAGLWGFYTSPPLRGCGGGPLSKNPTEVQGLEQEPTGVGEADNSPSPVLPQGPRPLPSSSSLPRGRGGPGAMGRCPGIGREGSTFDLTS